MHRLGRQIIIMEFILQLIECSKCDPNESIENVFQR
jgi:hypothetical protein